jgi:hypothetical protein
MESKYKEVHKDFGKEALTTRKEKERVGEDHGTIPRPNSRDLREEQHVEAAGHRQDKVRNLTDRYLVPNDLSAYHFNYIIRKRIKLAEKDSLYFFVNGKYLLKGGKWSHLDTLMTEVY